MTVPKLYLTDIGAREMAKQGELIITRVAFGGGSLYGGETDVPNLKKATSMTGQLVSLSPTISESDGFKIIEIMLENSVLEQSETLKKIGVFAKVGNGSEFLAYYGIDFNGIFVPNKRDLLYTLRLKFKIALSGRDNITVEVNNNLQGMATADAVNTVANKVDKFKTGSAVELNGIINVDNLGALLGKVAKTNNDVDNLSTPGIYQYTTNMASKGISSSYGFILVYSNMIGSPGQNGHFTWQIFVGTNGRMWVRKRINTEAWNVTDVANGNVLTALLRKFGLDEWGATVSINTCQSGTNFGTFLASSTVPIGFNIVKDNNAPAKTVYVWKQSNAIASCFAMADNGSFLIATLNGGRLSEWKDLSQGLTVQTSANQDFGDYLRSSAVPIGISAQKDSRTGAFGQVTKVDNNNVFFTGTMRKQGKTYQVAYAIVDGVKPSAFTEWALIP